VEQTLGNIVLTNFTLCLFVCLVPNEAESMPKDVIRQIRKIRTMKGRETNNKNCSDVMIPVVCMMISAGVPTPIKNSRQNYI
jgi:hypothetical protein